MKPCAQALPSARLACYLYYRQSRLYCLYDLDRRVQVPWRTRTAAESCAQDPSASCPTALQQGHATPLSNSVRACSSGLTQDSVSTEEERAWPYSAPGTMLRPSRHCCSNRSASGSTPASGLPLPAAQHSGAAARLRARLSGLHVLMRLCNGGACVHAALPGRQLLEQTGC